MNINTESQLRTEAGRGNHAIELLQDELLVEAFSVLNDRLTKEWADSPARDTEGRERIGWKGDELTDRALSHFSRTSSLVPLCNNDTSPFY